MLSLLAVISQTLASAAQSFSATSISFQGALTGAGGQPLANGNYDLTFKFYDVPTGGTALATRNVPNVPVTGGLASTPVLVDAAWFNGQTRYLGIVIANVNNGQEFSPRVLVTAVPYALRAVDAATAWSFSGNSNTVPPIHFLGTTDNRSLVFKVNNAPALRLEPGILGAPNVIGGSLWNLAFGASGATIGGGGATNYDDATFSQSYNYVGSDFGTIGGGRKNGIRENSSSSAIGGGSENIIQNDSRSSTICGGNDNTIQTSCWFSIIGGGSANTIENDSTYSVISGGNGIRIGTSSYSSAIGGGSGNTIQPHSPYSVIGGGVDNIIQTDANDSAIGGGTGNSILTGAWGSVVPGGYHNNASGPLSFAAGTRAKANHPGAFVWADSQDADFASTGNRQFLIRAEGGVGIGTAEPHAALDVSGTVRMKICQITGGADLAEHLNVTDADPQDEFKIESGMVVSIDPSGNRKFKLADEPYDRKRVGIISGGHGVKPGLVLRDEGNPLADGEQPIALSGQVWCHADATFGPITPGDLLTTSSTRGHAMKASDDAKARFAVLGQALTSLKEGRGWVQVLVRCQ